MLRQRKQCQLANFIKSFSAETQLVLCQVIDKLKMKISIKAIQSRILVFIAVHMFVQSSFAQSSSISKLKFIDEYVIPFNQSFRNTSIGGLSGVDYDDQKDSYYVLSDDRSDVNPARFYTTKIRLSQKGIDTVLFSDVHFLLNDKGEKYASFKQHPELAVDPEDIRYNRKTGQITWSSEGERIITEKENIITSPSILFARINGDFISTLPLPSNLVPRPTESGPRRNGTLEGISYTNDFKTLFAALEEPLYEDGPRADNVKSSSWSRIYQLDLKSNKTVAQYAYLLESVAYPAEPASAFKVNGISEILALNNKLLLTVERSFSVGRQPCTIKIFLADLSQADNIAEVHSLKDSPPAHPAKKSLLLNMDDLGIYIDNVEGATFGPKLPNGHQTLIFVTDNNFQQKQKTQVLLFEVIP